MGGGMFGNFMDKLGDIDLSQMQGLMGGQEEQPPPGMPFPIPVPSPSAGGGDMGGGFAETTARQPTETYSTGPHGAAPMDPLMQMMLAQGGALQPARVPMSSTMVV
jgi:hypothetical protein